MRFIDRFPTIDELREATPEQIGVAIVAHLKTLGENRRTISLTTLDASVGVRGHYHVETLLLTEGVEWARRALLLVPDLTQPIQSGWMVLSRAGQEFDPERDLELIRLREALPRSLLHPKVKEASLDIFNAGRFEAAVFEAFKLVEIAVREDAGYTERDYGTDMVARAFNADNGPLSDAAKPDAERQAMQRLMSGAHGVFRESSKSSEPGFE